MTDHIERTTNNIGRDIASKIPPEYLDDYLKKLDVLGDEGLDLSNGWINICEFTNEGCKGVAKKGKFYDCCVNKGKNCSEYLNLK